VTFELTPGHLSLKERGRLGDLVIFLKSDDLTTPASFFTRRLGVELEGIIKFSLLAFFEFFYVSTCSLELISETRTHSPARSLGKKGGGGDGEQ